MLYSDENMVSMHSNIFDIYCMPPLSLGPRRYCIYPSLLYPYLAMPTAPTGSGKTVLFELAIIRMLNQVSKTGHAMKCVYMAPTKALCSERYHDWTTKFDALGIKCKISFITLVIIHIAAQAASSQVTRCYLARALGEMPRCQP